MTIYQDMAARTGGNIYLGVVGPVRTGKSTFVKRFMEQLVLPAMEDPYRVERARDELPQSGSGKTIMTTEPKFVPEEAVTISPDGTARLQVRLIDSVGYMVEGAVGVTEDGEPRMVTTPWFPEEIPMTQAAELGTQKVMQDHCTIGIVVTTDGTVTDIPRQDYVDAERRAIVDMQATQKPFVVIVNTKNPQQAQELCRSIRASYGAACVALDCQTMEKETICSLLQTILMEFPMGELQFFFPGWVQALEPTHAIKAHLYDAIRTNARGLDRLRQVEAAMAQIGELEEVSRVQLSHMDLGDGTVCVEVQFPEKLFYGVLGEAAGRPLAHDRDLITLLRELSAKGREYDRFAPALEAVNATGYGVVVPEPEQMLLERPELQKKGGSYGIRIRASAPSIHLMRTDILTEINPVVGDAAQTQSLVHQMQEDYENDTEKLWQSNLFGKSVSQLIGEGFTGKLAHIPPDAQAKLRNALSRIVNDGATGMICILF